MTDKPDPLQRLTDVQQALDALIENARLLGYTEARQFYVGHSQQDAGLERYLHERISKQSADLRERLAQPEQESVTAQHRFRHPEKTKLDWSEWQECKVSNRPACEIDSQGYEVEYRNLYTAPQQREWQGLTKEEMQKLAETNLVYQPESYEWSGVFDLIRAVEAKLKEKK